MRALVIEDEPLLQQTLKENLDSQQFVVDQAFTSADALEHIVANHYDLVLVDLNLPDGDGLELIPQIKKVDAETAVIIITARGNLEDRVKGLNLGSDDYLSKPFSIHELTARIHAVLRRRYKIANNTIEVGPMQIFLDEMKIKLDGKEIDCTQTEYQLLRYLVLNKNKVISRIALAEHIWGDRVDDRYSLDFINSHVKNLRKKIDHPQLPDLIETVYGVGYRLTWHND
jgi:DNA-binding response OmpR family regulator